MVIPSTVIYQTREMKTTGRVAHQQNKIALIELCPLGMDVKDNVNVWAPLKDIFYIQDKQTS